MAFQKQGMGQGLSGRLGGVVYRQVDGETIAAAAPVRVNPQTPGQVAARQRLERANDLWSALPLDAIDRWRRYAASEGGARSSGYSVFRGLAARYLHLHNGYEAPSEPPGSPFLGDGIVVGASGDGAGVAFAASGPNSADVVTELLVQALPARHRLPKARDYRTAGFVAFAAEAVVVPLPAGAYACGARFVRASTGQATAMIPLGTVEVGG